MTEAVVAKGFPYWDNDTIIKFKAGESFDFPQRSYRSLMRAGFLVNEDAPVDTESEVKKPRGRKPKTERFRLDHDAGLVPELGE